MEQILINLVAGALGGVGAGKSSPTFDLGMIGNIISGLVGGGVLGPLAAPYSRRSLAQSRTKLLPDGQPGDFRGQATSHGVKRASSAPPPEGPLTAVLPTRNARGEFFAP
jgi:uncharacterized membrane protein YeaQ/YmgE (transglycosylase-associated protein family)